MRDFLRYEWERLALAEAKARGDGSGPQEPLPSFQPGTLRALLLCASLLHAFLLYVLRAVCHAHLLLYPLQLLTFVLHASLPCVLRAAWKEISVQDHTRITDNG